MLALDEFLLMSGPENARRQRLQIQDMSYEYSTRVARSSLAAGAASLCPRLYQAKYL